MVIKISKSEKIEAVVGYNMEKVEQQQATLLDSWRIPVEFDEKGIPFKQEIVYALEDRAMLNARVKKSVTHISLNPDPDDPVSDELLTKMSKELLTTLGYGDQPYIIVKHADIDRHHVHIVVSNIDADGKKINDSFEKFRTNAIRKSLENKYKLQKAEEATRKEEAARQERSVTNQIRMVGGKIFAEYHFLSYGEYRSMLEECGIVINDVLGGDGEKIGLSYALCDSEKKNRTPWIAESQIGKNFSYASIEQRAAEDKAIVQKYCRRRYVRRILEKLLDESSDRNALNKSAKTLGFSLIFRLTEQGRVYGCTVIDHKKKMIFNASRVDRKLSAKAWQRFFPENEKREGRTLLLGRAMPDFALPVTPLVAEKNTSLGSTLHPMATTGTGLGIQGGGGSAVHQEKANTHFRGDDEEEERLRRKRKKTE